MSVFILMQSQQWIQQCSNMSIKVSLEFNKAGCPLLHNTRTLGSSSETELLEILVKTKEVLLQTAHD